MRPTLDQSPRVAAARMRSSEASREARRGQGPAHRLQGVLARSHAVERRDGNGVDRCSRSLGVTASQSRDANPPVAVGPPLRTASDLVRARPLLVSSNREIAVYQLLRIGDSHDPFRLPSGVDVPAVATTVRARGAAGVLRKRDPRTFTDEALNDCASAQPGQHDGTSTKGRRKRDGELQGVGILVGRHRRSRACDRSHAELAPAREPSVSPTS